jgi:putative DNA primase/helicase
MRDNPNGLGLVLDELAPTFRKISVEREDGDDLREILIKSWSRLTPHLYESEAQGDVFIPRACLAVVGSIQPGPFSEFIASAVAAGDDGLVQRNSMMVWPDPVRLPRPEGKPNTGARERADEVFRALIGMDPLATGAVQGEFDKVPHLEFVPEAQKIFEAWEDINITKAQDEGGALGTHLDKYKTLTCGLAMLRELTDWASAPLSPPEHGIPWPHRKALAGVGVGATKAAVELTDFFEAHARRAYGLSDASAVAARALATKVRDGEVTDRMTLRKIQRKKWPGLRLAHEVRDAVEMLQDLGWLKLEQKPSATPGRPTIIIKLHPDHKNGVLEELPAAPTG